MVEEIIDNVLIFVVVTSGLGYLTSAALRSKPRLDATSGERIFSYVRGFKALALISIVLPVFNGVLSLYLYRAGDADYSIWFGICLIFAAVSAYLLLECFAARLLVSDQGITSLSPWTGQRTFRWEEIESICYSKKSMWYVIVGPVRKKIYASEYLSGFGVLSTEFRKRIPQDRWCNSGVALKNEERR
jgi:hypothetical protein